MGSVSAEKKIVVYENSKLSGNQILRLCYQYIPLNSAKQ